MRERLERLSSFAVAYATTRWSRRFRDRAELERWQHRRVQRHLRWVIAHSPFYAELYAGRDVGDWQSFPTIDKATMMDAFSRLNTAGIDRAEAEAVALRAEQSRDFSSTIGDVTVGLSSGTSGNRGLFLVRPHERNGWAGALLAKIVPEPIGLTDHRMALFLRANSRLYESVGGKRFQFAFFDLFRPIDELAEDLERYAPTILAGPPSVLRVLADRKRAGRLRVSPVRIVSAAEVLDPLDRTTIERAFGRAVHEVYQCTEGFLGASCAWGTLHLNEDLVAVQPEWLDHERFTPIVTDFTRRTQPIVRYRLNDVLVARRGDCPCGSPFRALARIEGRSDDVLEGRSSDGRAVPVFADLVTRRVIAASAAIEEYAVLQTAHDRLQISLRIADEHRPAAEERVALGVRAAFAELGAAPPSIAFARELPSAGATKLRRVRRAFETHVEGRPS